MLKALACAMLFAAVFAAPAPQNQGPQFMFQRMPNVRMQHQNNRRQSPHGGFPGGQFGDPMLQFRNHNFQQFGVNEETGGEGTTSEDDVSGFMSIITAPRTYLNSMMDGVRNYFTEEEEEEQKESRRYPGGNRLPGHRGQGGNFMNFRGPQVPQMQYQNLLANGHRFQDLNSVFQPSFNQFRGPIGGMGPHFPQGPIMGAHSQHSFQNIPHHNLPTMQQAKLFIAPKSGKKDGHWTGGFSSHYKQMIESTDQRPIYHVTNTEDNSERFNQHLTSTHTHADPPQEVAASTYTSIRRSDNLIPFESEDASDGPQGFVSRADGAFVESL